MTKLERKYRQFRGRMEAAKRKEEAATDPYADALPQPEVEFATKGRRIVKVTIEPTVEIHGYPRGGKLRNIYDALVAGGGIRAVARTLNVHKTTVGKVRRQIVKQSGEILCACGLPTTHQGWCRVRFAASPKRQAVMRKLHRASEARLDSTAGAAVSVAP